MCEWVQGKGQRGWESERRPRRTRYRTRQARCLQWAPRARVALGGKSTGRGSNPLSKWNKWVVQRQEDHVQEAQADPKHPASSKP